MIFLWFPVHIQGIVPQLQPNSTWAPAFRSMALSHKGNVGLTIDQVAVWGTGIIILFETASDCLKLIFLLKNEFQTQLIVDISWYKQICRQYQQSVGLNKAGVSTCFSLSQSKNLVMVETCWNSAWQTGWTVSLQGCSNSYANEWSEIVETIPHQTASTARPPWSTLGADGICGSWAKKKSGENAGEIEGKCHQSQLITLSSWLTCSLDCHLQLRLHKLRPFFCTQVVIIDSQIRPRDRWSPGIVAISPTNSG